MRSKGKQIKEETSLEYKFEDKDIVYQKYIIE